MALPHQHLTGQTFHSIRRTVEGIYYLAPSDACVRGLAYTYGVGVEESGVIPHVEMTMSNHRQGVLTCLTGLRFRFHMRHHGIFAEQYNGYLRRSGYMWDHRGPTQPILLSGEDDQKFFFADGESKEQKQRWVSRWDAQELSTFERTIVYDLLNPVAANMVEHVRSHPGFKITPDDWGNWNVNRRPGWIDPGYPNVSAFMALPPPEYWDNAEFIDTGDTRFVVSPDTLAAFEERRAWAKAKHPRGADRFDHAAFELFISPGNLEAAREHFNGLVDLYEIQMQQERQAAGKRVFGRRNLINQDPFKRPVGPDPIKRNARYKPRFTGSQKAVSKANGAYPVFCANYWEPLSLFKENRDFSIVFPAGTVKMAEVANVVCRGAPLPEENPMPRRTR